MEERKKEGKKELFPVSFTAVFFIILGFWFMMSLWAQSGMTKIENVTEVIIGGGEISIFVSEIIMIDEKSPVIIERNFENEYYLAVSLKEMVSRKLLLVIRDVPKDKNPWVGIKLSEDAEVEYVEIHQKEGQQIIKPAK